MNILYLGPPSLLIEQCLQEQGHKVMRTEDRIDIDFLQAGNFDFGISYRYRHIIRPKEIDFFSGKLINLHISMLPWNRGSDPNIWSFLEDSPRGISIHKIDSGIDTGDIICQKELAIDVETATLESSWLELNTAIQEMFVSNSREIINGGYCAIPQQGAGSFHTLKDKIKYAYLLYEDIWKTPVKLLLGKARY